MDTKTKEFSKKVDKWMREGLSRREAIAAAKREER